MTEGPVTPHAETGMAISKLLGAEVQQALDLLSLAVYVLDASGIVRWSNQAAAAITGPGIGESYLRLIAPEQRPKGKIHFARTVVGGAAVDFALTLVGRGARRVGVRVYAAPLRHRSTVIGAIGIVMRLDEQIHAKTAATHVPQVVPDLTPRQEEVLELLARGHDTSEIADQLGIAIETARNHVRHLLKRLGVHSRLEAVYVARRRGLLRDGSLLARDEE
jgi:DNA-binding CsgD family transcriptional regulator